MYDNRSVKYEHAAISDVVRNGVHRKHVMLLDDNDDSNDNATQVHRLN